MTNQFVNKSVIDCINQEIEQLEIVLDEIKKLCKENNLDIRFNRHYEDTNNQLARLRRALKPLTNQYY